MQIFTSSSGKQGFNQQLPSPLLTGAQAAVSCAPPHITQHPPGPVESLSARQTSLWHGVAELSTAYASFDSDTKEQRNNLPLKSQQAALVPCSACTCQGFDSVPAQQGLEAQLAQPALNSWPPALQLQLQQVPSATARKNTQLCLPLDSLIAWSYGWGRVTQVSTLHPQTDLRVLMNSQALISAIFWKVSL